MPKFDTADDVLLHYGIKGMKWGVRRTDAQIEAASEDAQRVNTNKVRAKTSGTDALNTKELQELVNRMNLEQQYSRLNPKQESLASKGAKFVGKIGQDIAAREMQARMKGKEGPATMVYKGVKKVIENQLKG